LRGSAEANSNRARRQADEPRILHPSLPVLDRFAVDGVVDHGDEGGDSGVLGDEAEIPALLRWTDQRLLEAPRQTIDPPRREKTGSLSHP